MISIAAVKERNMKIRQKRYGVSIIYGMPFNIFLKNEISSLINDIENMMPSSFIWYNKFHLTAVRCISILDSILYKNINCTNLLECFRKVPIINLNYKNTLLNPDGVIRIYFNKIEFPLYANNVIRDFYENYSLNYKIINEPWIALGNINLNKISLQEPEFNEFIKYLNTVNFTNISIDELNIVYYEDVLFEVCYVLGKTYLKG